MKTFNSCLSKILSRAMLMGTAILLATLTYGSSAQACRDCPFPLKVSDHQWLMPESKVVVTIEERQVSKTTVMMSVVLRNADNGRVLARGTAMHGTHQRNVDIVLHDIDGRRVQGSISWIDDKKDKIQAAFSCEDSDDDDGSGGSCSIGRDL